MSKKRWNGAPAAIAAGMIAIVAATAGIAAPPSGAAAGRSPETHALLINGGGSAKKNFLSHLHHLQDMAAELRRRGLSAEHIHVFSGDGDNPQPDLVTRQERPPAFWLVEGTAIAGSIDPAAASNTVWEETTLHKARKGPLRRWFDSMARRLQPGDTLLVFVTDHGTRNKDDPDNGLISLWNESLSVLEFRAMLAHLRPGVRVMNLMSQCFSGAFADAMTPLNSPVPTGDVCGFYSTMRGRRAYGCYPEGRDRDRIGHAFRFIDAMKRNVGLNNAHLEVLLSDTTPDVPIRTSDLYLQRLLQDEAERRDVDADTFVDEMLRSAWKDRARWEPEIRRLDRIGELYGTFSPRSFAELKPQLDELRALFSEVTTYRQRWRLALDDLRRDNLRRFARRDESWRERLLAKKLAALDADERRETLDELLAELEEFTREREEVWDRLERLHGWHEAASSSEYRVAVRLAALLRMRVLLTRVAGMQLLDEIGADEDGRLKEGREALAALTACESAPVGTPEPLVADAMPVELEGLPPFEEDLETVRRVLPSWLGIRFQSANKKQRDGYDMERGAVVVSQVYEETPASRAGLEPGDFLLGPPGEPFVEPRQVREWIMTSPRDRPVRLEVLRDGAPLELSINLVEFPLKMPRLPGPPDVGDTAPKLASLTLVGPERDAEPLELSGRRHMLFFWATWCGPCKESVPELMAWSEQAGVPVIAISDEGKNAIRSFLDGWDRPFPQSVASDEMRESYLSYLVSGTPTFVLVGGDGRIEWRQTGYRKDEQPLAIDGWSWPGRTN